jgi:hypothetical protein
MSPVLHGMKLLRYHLHTEVGLEPDRTQTVLLHLALLILYTGFTFALPQSLLILSSQAKILCQYVASISDVSATHNPHSILAPDWISTA